jgi:predicted enzyme related to lactoylglutathione lyase
VPKKLNSALAFISIPSDNPAKSRDFYGQIFGIELVRSLSDQEGYHAPISDDGIDLNVNIRHSPQETTTAYLAVRDLQATLDATKAAGGKVVWGPTDMTMSQADFDEYKKAVKDVDGLDADTASLGRAAVVVDPGGSQVGFVQLANHTHKHFAVGEFQRPLDDHRIKVLERSKDVAKKRRPS